MLSASGAAIGLLVLLAAAEPPTDLTLEAAIDLALVHHPALRMARADRAAAEARAGASAARLLPAVDLVESWERGNNPVYVFGSLLGQERFGEENFAIDALNQPDPLTNWRTQVVARQRFFAGGRNWLGVRIAGLERDAADEGLRLSEMQAVVDVVRGYFAVHVAEADLAAKRKAEAVAGSDLERAAARYDTGMTTAADTLALGVHRAAIQEQAVRARSRAAIARAELNRILGLPLGDTLRLTTALDPGADQALAPVEDHEAEALAGHPAARQADLALARAEAEHGRGRSPFFPELDGMAAWEWNRPEFTADAGSNWLAGVTLRFNLFNGLGDVRRLEGTAAELERARAAHDDAAASIALGVRRAWFERQAADEALALSRAAVAAATEGHRIYQERYQAGLVSVTELLRAEEALLAAESRELGALHERRLAAVALALATGTLTAQSEALKP